jgi:hypothetical protein
VFPWWGLQPDYLGLNSTPFSNLKTLGKLYNILYVSFIICKMWIMNRNHVTEFLIVNKLTNIKSAYVNTWHTPNLIYHDYYACHYYYFSIVFKLNAKHYGEILLKRNNFFYHHLGEKKTLLFVQIYRAKTTTNCLLL